MSNLYIHYPYCKQACHYCNFHFSTMKKGRDQIMGLIEKELEIRVNEVKSPLDSIYFGGGSPSLISSKSLGCFIQKIKEDFEISNEVEITMEVNPDDVSKDYLLGLKESGINRLSLGIQSFFEKDLQLMNRAHSADQARKSLGLVGKYFDNFSLDFFPNPTSNDINISLISSDLQNINIKIKSRFKKDEGLVRFTMIDDGSGFPADIIDQIFEPYITTKEKSGGLGLAIVQNIIEQHEGQIFASNVEPQGARITIEFSIIKPEKGIKK